MRGLLIRCAWVLVAAVGVAGCGEEQTPAEAAPAVAESLQEVDAAIARADYAAARAALDELVRATTRARDSDLLDDGEADTILEAAARLEDELPADEEPAEEPPAEPAEEQTSPPPSPTGDDDDDEDEGDHGKGKGKGKDKHKKDD